jgi:uncharacterized protein YceK
MKKSVVLSLFLMATVALAGCGAVALHESRNEAKDLARQVSAQQAAEDSTAGLVAGVKANEDMFAELDGSKEDTIDAGDYSYNPDNVVYVSADDSDDSGDDDYVEGEGLGRAVDCLIEWMIDGVFGYDYKMVLEIDGVGVEAKGRLAAEGNDYAFDMEMLLMGEKIKTHIIKKAQTLYVIDDENKMILKMPVDKVDADLTSGMKTDYSNITLVGSGTGEFAGKTLPFEDYKEAATGETVRFFLDGDQVYGIFMEVDGATLEMVITNPTKEIPEGTFDLPKGYDTYSD